MTPSCLGIRVVHDPSLRWIAHSRGIGPWKKIVVGNDFFNFTPREQGAILLHEAGHCKLCHVEKRIINLWRAFIPKLMFDYLRNQEYQADYYAAQCGYGVDLATAFAKLRAVPQKLWYPDVDTRIARLLACSRE